MRRRVLLCAAVACAALVGAMSWGRVEGSPAPAAVDVHPAPGLKGAVATSLVGGGRLSPDRISRAVVEPPEIELPRAGREPEGEKAFYDLYTSRGVEAVERIARETLEGPGPDCEKVAVLRALYDLGSEEFPARFAWAIRSLPVISSPAGVSVPSFAVRFLGERASGDPGARSVLEQVTFESEPAVAPGLRRRAAARLAETGSAEDLSRLCGRLAGESDPLLVEGTLVALDLNPNRATADAIATAFGKPRLAPDKEKLP